MSRCPQHKKLEKLRLKSKAASSAVIAQLKKMFPEGTWWAVETRYQQVNPTKMEVIGHYCNDGHPCVRFRAETKPNKYGRNKRHYFCHELPVSKIFYRVL